MEEIKNLFRAFSEIKGFDGWMIGKLYFYREEKQVQAISSLCHDTKHEKRNMLSAAVIKKKKNFAVLEVTGEEIGIQMIVLKPQMISEVDHSDTMRKQTENKDSGGLCKKTDNGRKEFYLPEGCIPIISRVFSREEVQAFAEETGDDNWIHQMERPIVPGLMMAEWLWKMGEVSLVNKIMIFRSPVYAQEKIVVYQERCSQRYFAVAEEQRTMAGSNTDKKEKRLLWEIKNQSKKKEGYSLCK